MFALVAVIVGGVGMHRHSAQSIGRDAEIGDIIEACADYTVQASCSAASCNWNSATVQCEEAAHRQKKASFLSTNNEPYVAAAEREDTANSTGNSSATTAAPAAGTANVVGANGIITATISAAASAGSTSVALADIANLAVGMYLMINGAYYKIISITPARRLSEAGRRLAPAGTVGIAPALAAAVGAGTAITALPASTYELTWWKDHGAKFAHAGPAFSAAAAAAATKLATPATPAPATAVPAVTAAPTPAPFGGHDSACHQQFSAATSGQSNAAILTICASYKAGPVGVCTTTDSTTWITTWCASRR